MDPEDKEYQEQQELQEYQEHEEYQEYQVDQQDQENREQPAPADAVEPAPAYSFLELVYGVFFQPVQTLRYLSVQQKFLWGNLVFIGTYIFSSLMGFAVSRGQLPQYGLTQEEMQILSALAGKSWILVLPLAWGFWFTMVSIYHALAGLLKGRGSIAGIFAAFGFTSLPLLVGALVNFLESSLQLGGQVAGLFGVLIFIWIVVLQVIALRENYLVSTGRAVFIWFLPWIFLTVSLIIVVLLCISALIPLIHEIPPLF